MAVIHCTCYPIFGSFAIFNSTFFESFQTISLLNLLIWNKFWTKKIISFEKFFNVSGMKQRKYLDKAVWFNQVVLFLRSFCFMIELLAFQVSNIKLYLSRRCCSFVTHFGSIFPFMHPENIKNLWLSDVSKGYENLTKISLKKD